MYEDFKKRCLRDSVIAKRLHMVYGSGDNLDTRLDLENINKRVCLHAEMNILTEIINQRIKTRVFIAVSKKCCYLCKLYIEFVSFHKKVYDCWKLPVPNINANFINNSMKS
ncbi:hypothetical protein RhiirA5_411059 [Rhizophagus irregularis]|uniref:Uncharacterized protein n=1 Tax=Rhizophagus irregularis TaxID=588596 RepID=A0A2I1ERT2_9GLOM|nr:hypothetical protein RhiirA5_411059 [Rhizophagus irregularis]PKC71822.1 hypothetical protein RhiirA1_453092 [Rhizophagus irregularis]PKY24827.1 hypothetical protein RhiirB3_439528 [Rhizophagus irregularis]UZO25742.1 hypothetical protein OCT59_018003 [Rhizophagus irregularis]GBC41579.2 hypothetical protein GLOIN_2v1487101 [Rhizophagus irregularis DAOM 181602=DAOM 197198]